MRFMQGLVTAAATGLVLSAPATVDGVHKRYTALNADGSPVTIFEDGIRGSKLTFKTNTGICETTPGVNTFSGYLDVGSNMNMWFWFFEARKNPSTAPLALWLNGGPGCSSMIGLFQENGPCHFVNGSSTPTLNPHSWNTHANMLYVDQPIGTGFSYGTDPVNSTVTAAPYVWKLLQAFFAAFPQYETRDFGLFTESYGGHYGPEFASYFEDKNAAIAKGTVNAEKINLVALGVNNGWFDPVSQYKAYLDFSIQNTYKKLLTTSQYNSAIAKYNSQCLPAAAKCTSTSGNDNACNSADRICSSVAESPAEKNNDFDGYDIREPSNDPYPPETYVSYLQTPAIAKAIGAMANYSECPDAPYNKIAQTGDDFRSFLPALNKVVQSGIRVLIWAGDADWICNWVGGLEVANSVDYGSSSSFRSKAVAPYTVNNVTYGEYKTAGNLSWLKVYQAGHEVPYYQPEVALQAFWQTMQKKSLSPT